MTNSNSTPGVGGIAGIVIGTIAVSVIISEVSGTYLHWPFVLLGIIVGLMAVRAINR